MSSIPTWNKYTVQNLRAIREPLKSFASQVLLEGCVPELKHQKAAILPRAFDDYNWRSSKLFKSASTTDWSFEQYLPGFGKTDNEKSCREKIGEDWALLSLYAFAVDREFMRLLYFGSQAYLMRTVPLRIIPSGDFPCDWVGLSRLPSQRWKITPQSILYVYGAFLIHIISQNWVHQWELPEFLGPVGNYIKTLARIKELIKSNYQNIEAGDLLIADGLISALIQSPNVKFKDLEYLLCVSPLTQILHMNQLLEIAGGQQKYIADLLRPDLESSWGETALLSTICGAGYLPGIHYRLAQCLADLCQFEGATPKFPSILEALARTIERLDYYIVNEKNLYEREPTESEFWVGALLTRMISLVQQDKNLEVLKAYPSAEGLLKPFQIDGLVDLLYQRLPNIALKGTCYQYIKKEKERLDPYIRY